MNNKLIPKENIFKEVFSKGYFNRAHTRAQRRKSAWNLILVPFALAGVGVVFYGLFRLSWQIHMLMYPEHIGRFNEFWQKGISGIAFISSFLLVIPLFFAAIPLGLMFANCIAWCILPARKTFEKEAKGHTFTSFKESMSGLFKFSLLIVPICLILSFIGAATLKNLK